MSQNIIFCFSGTGNGLDIAKNIAKVLGDTDIVMMRYNQNFTDASEAKRVGFVFPCYGGGLPGGVEDFMRRVRIAPDAYVFGVSTSASYLGTGLYKLDNIHNLDYWKGVNHQCSCIWLFPHNVMIPMLPADKAQKRAEKLAKKIGQDILAGKTVSKCPPNNAFNAVESKAWPTLVPLKAKKLTVSDACISCGQCAKLCPRGNIVMNNGKPQFGNKCVQCLSCLQYCPKEAINMGSKTQKREHYHNVNISAAELMKDIIHID